MNRPCKITVTSSRTLAIADKLPPFMEEEWEEIWEEMLEEEGLDSEDFDPPATAGSPSPKCLTCPLP